MIQLFSFALVFPLLLFLWVLVKQGRPFSSKQLPPGPWKLPLIGNLHHLSVGLPHQTLSRLAEKHGPIMHLQLGEISTVLISSADVAQEALTTHDIALVQRPRQMAYDLVPYNNVGVTFAPYGSYWKRLRKICAMQLLGPNRVESYRAIRQEEVSKMMDSISSHASLGKAVNVRREALVLSNTLTARAAVGEINNDADEFISILSIQTEVRFRIFLLLIFPSYEFLHWITGVRRVIVETRQKLDRILSNIDIFTAGNQNLAVVIEWAMAHVLKSPQVMEKAQTEVRQAFKAKGGKIEEREIQELPYMKSVIKETLRLHPPLPIIQRETSDTCNVHGYEIPVKTQVLFNAWAINRDPKHWDDADSFRPERFLDSSLHWQGKNFEYIPFGAGRRICPGMTFAASIVEVVLANLLYHFDWKLPDGARPQDLDMNDISAIVAKKEKQLLAISTPNLLLG
ncbi:hypothetical protein RJ640_014243 [Escallonia rubra]|uniref:Cytochrome P450 n=1 Tax=Escallonia rubra TaxID=112253 RepID=A0AA88U5F4_9ASTE|nr:hypothetical protein RJ640_014243 [Escallonia rubra]